jgi:hypothetical protein
MRGNDVYLAGRHIGGVFCWSLGEWVASPVLRYGVDTRENKEQREPINLELGGVWFLGTNI